MQVPDAPFGELAELAVEDLSRVSFRDEKSHRASLYGDEEAPPGERAPMVGLHARCAMASVLTEAELSGAVLDLVLPRGTSLRSCYAVSGSDLARATPNPVQVGRGRGAVAA